jgi:hypothetical protein
MQLDLTSNRNPQLFPQPIMLEGLLLQAAPIPAQRCVSECSKERVTHNLKDVRNNGCCWL